MTEKSELDTQALYAIRRASIEAAKALLDKTQEDGQVRVVAEKIAIQAMGVAIGQSYSAWDYQRSPDLVTSRNPCSTLKR